MATSDQMEARKDFIQAHPEMTLTQLASELKLSYSVVYNICMIYDLPYKELRKHRRVSDKTAAGMFDETEQQNWLC